MVPPRIVLEQEFRAMRPFILRFYFEKNNTGADRMTEKAAAGKMTQN